MKTLHLVGWLCCLVWCALNTYSLHDLKRQSDLLANNSKKAALYLGPENRPDLWPDGTTGKPPRVALAKHLVTIEYGGG